MGFFFNRKKRLAQAHNEREKDMLTCPETAREAVKFAAGLILHSYSIISGPPLTEWEVIAFFEDLYLHRNWRWKKRVPQRGASPRITYLTQTKTKTAPKGGFILCGIQSRIAAGIP